MDKSLEVTYIKIEPNQSTPSDRLKIPTELIKQVKISPELQLNSVKQESNCLAQSEIYIKTEPQDDENEFPVIADTSHGVNLSNDINDEIYESILKIEGEDEIMQDPLDVDSKKDEEHVPIHLNEELRIKNEPTEKDENISDGEDFHSIKSNHGQKHLLLRNDRKSRDKKYICDICNKSFTKMSNWNKHLRIHTGEKPFECGVCEKPFNEKSNLDKHMLIHSGEKAHSCDVCKKVFRQKSHLKSHRLIHGGLKPFFCQVCNNSFTKKTNLVRHERLHTGEKPYICDVCDKAFAQKTNLTEHRRLHTGEKPYFCNNCNKSFADRSSFSRHKKIHKN